MSNQLQLSKSYKKRLRKVKCKYKKTEDQEKKLGLKFYTKIGRKFNFYRTSTYERVHECYLFDPSLKDEDIAAKFIDDVCNINIGSFSLDINKSLKRNGNFVQKVLIFVNKLRKINLKGLLDYCCPILGSKPVELNQLFSFLKTVLFKSQCQELFSSQTHALENCIKKCITRKKSDVLWVGEIIHGFKASAWMEGYSSNKKQLILAKLVCWVVDTFLHLLLKSFFHVTDSACSKQLVFYRKRTWQSITDRALLTLIKTRSLHKLDVSKRAQISRSSYAQAPAKLRFMPKKNLLNVRPIGKRSNAYRVESDFLTLTREFADAFPAKSDLSGRTLHREWNIFTSKISKSEAVFWITADITDAFGSIRIDKLCSILKKLVKEANFRHHSGITDRLCRMLFVNTVTYRIGGQKQMYLVRQGVIQGDPLSSNLSDIYYGDCLATHLSDFLSAPPGCVEIFLRGADDFLFVSTNRERVARFLNIIQSGFENYNCFFEPSKMRTNVISEDQRSPFKYCGSLFHLSTKEISPNYSSLANTNIYSSFMGAKSRWKPGYYVASKFSFFCRIRQIPLYYGKFNSMDRILTTLASNVSIALRRLTCLLDIFMWSRGRSVQEKWLWATLIQGFRRFRGSALKSGVNASVIRWITFYCLLSELRRSSQYSSKIKVGVKNALDRINLSLEKLSWLKSIVDMSHKETKYYSIKAKAGFKHLQY